MATSFPLNQDNFESNYLRFENRQAGVSLVFCPEEQKYYYNVYCLELKLVKEIFSVEHEYLQDALELCSEEFGTWELVSFEEKSGCGNCAAK